jgi:hypothetical protein
MKSVHRPSPASRDAFWRVARDFSVEALSEGPVAGLARDVLGASGKIDQRRSPLQPLFVLWLLLLRHLFGQDSWVALFERLSVSLRGRMEGLDLRTVTDGALSHARERLGPEPLVLLLARLADSLPPRSLFHGLRVCALDGVRMDVPDTPANHRAFERRRSQRGPAGWPQVLLLVLLETSLRLPLAARVAPCRASEKVVARELLDSLGDADLLLLDAGFYGVPFFLAVQARGAVFLCPVPRHVRFRRRGPVRVQGHVRDYLCRIRAREPLPAGRTRTRWMQVRVLEVHSPGFRPRRFVTNLLDPFVPAVEIVALYPRRWEIEEAFDEIKTVLCHPPAGAAPTELRSKSPRGVVQEAFALLCTYSLLRRTMALAATTAGVSPADLSFTAALRLTHLTALLMMGAPARKLEDLYQALLRDIALHVLYRPTIPRHCPREVKRKRVKYPFKTPRLARVA